MPTAIADYRLVKAAAGDAQTFENSLATIGRQFLSAKAPGLFDHEIGFQVLDSDDDNTKAVGVFGFRVGNKLLYVPLFYRDGMIKGTEQLRDPKRKVTVPLSDNWVNKYLSDQGDDPPELRDRGKTQDTALPSLWQFKYPPSKFAGDWVAEVKADLALAIGRVPAPASSSIDLIKVAADYPEILFGVGKLAADYPWFSNALAKFHGPEKVASALRTAESFLSNVSPKPKSPGVLQPSVTPVIPVKTAAEKPASVHVIRVSSVHISRGPLTPGLDFSPEELTELKEGRNAYRDDRKDNEKSAVTFVGDAATLSNPSAHGIYEVLGRDHKFHPCAVFMPLVGWGAPVGRCLVVRLDDKAWAYSHPNAVWVRGEAGGSQLHEWLEKQPQVKDDVPEGDCTIATLPGRHRRAPAIGAVHATVPFHSTGDGSAYPITYPMGKRPFWAELDPWEDAPGDNRVQSALRTGKAESIHIGSRVPTEPRRVEVFSDPDPTHDKPVLSGNQIYIPGGAFRVALGKEDFRLGDGVDPERALFSMHKAAGDLYLELTRAGGSKVEISDPRTDTVTTYKIAADAEAALVESHGLAVSAARRLVDAVSAGKKAAAFVKYADRYNLSHNSPAAPPVAIDQLAAPSGFADNVVPSQSAAQLAVPVTDMLPDPGAYDRFRPYPVQYGVKGQLPGIDNGAEPPGPTPTDLQTVAGAAASGKRELFDTAALAALVKNTRLHTLLDRTRSKLLRTVSDLADMLAHLYWNTSEWSDQFGETEIGPLEDQLRDQFEGLGELVLTLQEKAVTDGLDAGILPGPPPGDGADAKA